MEVLRSQQSWTLKSNEKATQNHKNPISPIPSLKPADAVLVCTLFLFGDIHEAMIFMYSHGTFSRRIYYGLFYFKCLQADVEYNCSSRTLL